MCRSLDPFVIDHFTSIEQALIQLRGDVEYLMTDWPPRLDAFYGTIHPSHDYILKQDDPDIVIGAQGSINSQWIFTRYEALIYFTPKDIVEVFAVQTNGSHPVRISG